MALSIVVSAGYRENEANIRFLLLGAVNKSYVLLKELGDFAAIYELMVYTDKANMSTD
ncbi:MAG: hypothetical protein AB7U98_00265 [Candidatus Nitrosocosmicus sp.]